MIGVHKNVKRNLSRFSQRNDSMKPNAWRIFKLKKKTRLCNRLDARNALIRRNFNNAIIKTINNNK